MASKADRVTTSEFSSLSGIPDSKVSRLIREGRIRATKQAGKWMILKSQLKAKAVIEYKKAKKKPKSAVKSASKSKTSPKKAIAKKKTPVKKVVKTAKKSKHASPKKKPVKTKISESKISASKKKTIKREKSSVQKKTAANTNSKSNEKTYSVEEFSEMTYLTKFGVIDWLKRGWLKGEKRNTGEWRVNASSMELSRMIKLKR